MASIKILNVRPFLVQKWSKVFFDNKLHLSKEVAKLLKEGKSIKEKIFEFIKLTTR